jgi:hypothetical protein
VTQNDIFAAFSFSPGEVFVVHNDMGDGWLWVTSQSTGLSGIVNRELVKDLVGTQQLFNLFLFCLILL